MVFSFFFFKVLPFLYTLLFSLTSSRSRLARRPHDYTLHVGDWPPVLASSLSSASVCLPHSSSAPLTYPTVLLGRFAPELRVRQARRCEEEQKGKIRAAACGYACARSAYLRVCELTRANRVSSIDERTLLPPRAPKNCSPSRMDSPHLNRSDAQHLLLPCAHDCAQASLPCISALSFSLCFADLTSTTFFFRRCLAQPLSLVPQHEQRPIGTHLSVSVWPRPPHCVFVPLEPSPSALRSPSVFTRWSSASHRFTLLPLTPVTCPIRVCATPLFFFSACMRLLCVRLVCVCVCVCVSLCDLSRCPALECNRAGACCSFPCCVGSFSSLSSPPLPHLRLTISLNPPTTVLHLPRPRPFSALALPSLLFFSQPFIPVEL